MVAAESELAARVEAKAERLLKQRAQDITDARKRLESDNKERNALEDGLVSKGMAGLGLIVIPVALLAFGALFDTSTWGMDLPFSLGIVTPNDLSGAFALVGLVIAIWCYARTASKTSRAEDLARTVVYDEEAIVLAEERLENVKRLQAQVAVHVARFRNTDGIDREAAASQLRRLEGELDSELV